MDLEAKFTHFVTVFLAAAKILFVLCNLAEKNLQFHLVSNFSLREKTPQV